MPLHGRHWHFRRSLNWWIGILFAVGASQFALGGILVLAPALAQRWSLDASGIGTVFFSGSIPFTIAAYLQLMQAANVKESGAPEPSRLEPLAWLGWRPADPDWLSCALQFLGTLLFNINTLDAMLPKLNAMQQGLLVWTPDMVGSALFFASGYIAFAECCRGSGLWQPGRLSWWIVVVNLLGCLAFMVSAVLSFTPPEPARVNWLNASTSFIVIGALAFLAGALLLLPSGLVQKTSGSRPAAS